MRIIKACLTLLLLSVAVLAQEKGKTRVYITDSDSWQISGGSGGSSDGFGGGVSGGARPQTAEIIKTFNERCPDCIVIMKREKADYVVLLQHEGGKNPIERDNKFAIFNIDGDVIKSGSTRSLGNAVKDACAAIKKDVQDKGGQGQPTTEEGKN